MGLAPSGQHENTANLLYAEVPVPIYSHRRRAGTNYPEVLFCRPFRPLLYLESLPGSDDPGKGSAGPLGLNRRISRRIWHCPAGLHHLPEMPVSPIRFHTAAGNVPAAILILSVI
jgi:hypothetical protein